MTKKELLKQLLVAEKENPTKKISRPDDVVPMLMKYANKKEENFYAVLLNSCYEVISVQHITKGLVNRTMVHPREVFREAIKKNAVAVVIAHNHPSGNLVASSEDSEITSRMVEAGKIIGISVLDHIIVSKNGFYSFLESGKM